MAYNSAHTGPEIDAAVQQLGQIQEARDATNQDRIEVKDLAAQVKVDAGQISGQADIVSAKATQVAANAAAVEQARVQVVGASEAAESAMDAAVLSAASAEESQAAASASEQAAAQSQLAAGLSEQVSAEHAAEATSAATQVATDRAAAQASAASAAASAQNAEAVVTGGTASVTPHPGLIPLADAQGKIDADWLPEEVARTESVEAALEASAEAVNTASEARSRTASFLQPSPEAPAVRDDGSPLQVGDRYFNSVEQSEWIYTEDGWATNDSLAAIDSIKDATDPSKGGREVGYDGGSVSDVLDLARPLADYAALRNYSGSAKVVRITKAGIEGFFAKLAAGSYTDDNGVTILSIGGTAWRRLILSRVNVKWFEPINDGATDALPAFNAAAAAASILANGLAGDVDIPAGGWFLSGPVTTAANWYLDGAATIRGLPQVGSETLPMHDTSCLTGRLSDFRSGTGSQVRFGDPRPWLTKDWRPISECISTLTVINPSGRPAGLFATRTSDRNDTGALSYALSASVVNNDVVNVKGGWSAYLETYRASGAGNTFGMETDFLNLGDTVNLDPYSNLNSGLTANLWMGSGGGSTPLAPQANNLSACMALLPNSKGFDRGIVYRANSITGANKEAIASPADYRWAWYGSDRLVRSYVDSKTHQRTVSSDTISECPIDVSRKAGAGFTATPINSTIFRHEQHAFNGASYTTAGYQEINQKTDYASGLARFAYTMAVRNPSGGYASWSLNSVIDNTFGPDNDAASSLARASMRINNSYFAVAPTVTSDERDKMRVQAIADVLLDAWAQVEYTQYKLKDAVDKKGDGARWHFGIIAQRVKAEFEAVGIDAFEYGLLCHDSWEAQYEEVPAEYEVVEPVFSDILGPDGKPIVISGASRREIAPGYRKEILAAGERYGIRYEEAMCLEAALMRRVISRLQEEISKKING